MYISQNIKRFEKYETKCIIKEINNTAEPRVLVKLCISCSGLALNMFSIKLSKVTKTSMQDWKQTFAVLKTTAMYVSTL